MYKNNLNNLELITNLSECSDLLFLIKDRPNRDRIINRAKNILKEKMGNTPFQMEMEKIKLQYKSGFFSRKTKKSLHHV